MIFTPVRAIAIDNNPLELVSLVNGLSAHGLPCSAHLFDDADLVPAPPKDGYRHLRLAFVDMNLLDASGTDPKQLASIISNVLSQAVSKDCGPYTLIFWTSFPEKVEQVRPEVVTQLKELGIPPPALVTHLGKSDLIPVTNGKEAEQISIGLRDHISKQAELAEKLETSLSERLRQAGAASVASIWESLLAEAASNTMRELFGEARAISSENPSEAFQEVLATIATEAIGRKNAKDEPLVGLTEGLLDLVVDQLRTASSSQIAEEVVAAELGKSIKEGPQQLPGTTSARINRIFQAELFPAGSLPERVSRGLVVRPTTEALQQAGLHEAWERFIWSEILHDPARLNKEDPQREELLKRKEEVQAAVKPLLIEVGADCDHAQRKPRTHRYLIAAEVPSEYVTDFLMSTAPDRRTPFVSDAIERLGPWPHDGREVSIAVCCKRFFGIQTEKLPNGSAPVMRIRSALVNHLLHKYSVLATRPGFIQLR